MPPVLEMASVEDQHSFNLERWEELWADPVVRALTFRIETDRFGNMIATPIPGFRHASYQAQILQHLLLLLPEGDSLGLCAVSTSEGMRGPDAAWISKARSLQALKRDALMIAPEICVEVLSASNKREEIQSKKRLYFEAGAEEVSICDLSGRMFFFLRATPDESAEESQLCPDFPSSLA